MIQKTYKHFFQLQKVATEKNQEILETPVSFYFRIFENKQCTELHLFYKP
mgnify:CR=1 FL=1